MIKKDQIKDLKTEELFTFLKTSRDGLSDVDANNRSKEYGLNLLKSAPKGNALKLFVKQFKSSLIYLLLAAGVISFLLQDFNDGFVITVILIINTELGFYQEFKSEKAIFQGSEIFNNYGNKGNEVLIKKKKFQYF